MMTVLIVKDGLSTFQRDIALGGNQYTAALQKALGLSREDAEAVKLGGGLESGAGGRAHRPAQGYRGGGGEIQRPSRVLPGQCWRRIEKLYLSGGVAGSKG